MTVTYYVIEYDDSRLGRHWLYLASHGLPRGSRRKLSMTATYKRAGTWRKRARADALCAGAQDIFPGARAVAVTRQVAA